MPEKKALLVIDIQNDFLPGGALAVPHGDSVITPVNRLMRSGFTAVIASKDWHPADHCSFVPQGGPWPAHCVANTEGAALSPALDQTPLSHIVHKGMARDRDSYSAFFDNDHLHATGLNGLLRGLGISHVTLCGLALDYCVAWTARDALDLGFAVSLVPAACRAIAPDASACLAVLRESGVTLTDAIG